MSGATGDHNPDFSHPYNDQHMEEHPVQEQTTLNQSTTDAQAPVQQTAPQQTAGQTASSQGAQAQYIRIQPGPDDDKAYELTNHNVHLFYPESVRMIRDIEAVRMLHPCRYLPPPETYFNPLIPGNVKVPPTSTGAIPKCLNCFHDIADHGIKPNSDHPFLCSNPCAFQEAFKHDAHPNQPCPQLYTTLRWLQRRLSRGFVSQPMSLQRLPSEGEFHILRQNGWIVGTQVYSQEEVPEFTQATWDEGGRQNDSVVGQYKYEMTDSETARREARQNSTHQGNHQTPISQQTGQAQTPGYVASPNRQQHRSFQVARQGQVGRHQPNHIPPQQGYQHSGHPPQSGYQNPQQTGYQIPPQQGYQIPQQTGYQDPRMMMAAPQYPRQRVNEYMPSGGYAPVVMMPQWPMYNWPVTPGMPTGPGFTPQSMPSGFIHPIQSQSPDGPPQASQQAQQQALVPAPYQAYAESVPAQFKPYLRAEGRIHGAHRATSSQRQPRHNPYNWSPQPVVSVKRERDEDEDDDDSKLEGKRKCYLGGQSTGMAASLQVHKRKSVSPPVIKQEPMSPTPIVTTMARDHSKFLH